MLNHEEIFQQVRFEEAIYEAFRGKLPPKKKLEEEEDEPEHDPSERLADDVKKEAGGTPFRSYDLLPDPKNPPRRKIANFLRKTVGMKPLEESMASAVDEFVLVRDMHKHKMPKPVEVFVDAPPRPIRDPHPPSPENHFGTVAGVTLSLAVATFMALGFAKQAIEKAWREAKRYWDRDPTLSEVKGKLTPMGRTRTSPYAESYSSQLFLIESDEVMEPILARRILAEFKNLTERRNRELKDVPDSKFLLLTPREEEMMLMIAEGKPNKMIANHMGIAENTVRNHIANIFAKLQVNNRTEAAIQAYKATRDPIEGLEPRSGPVLPFPKEFKASSLESPTKQDLVTLTNISLALDQLQRQLSTFGRVQHTSKIYEDTITAVYSALLMWRDQELNTAAQLTTSHKFPQAKRIVDKVIETAKKNSEKKHNQPLDVLIQKNIEKKQEYRQKDFANRRTQRVLNKMRTK